MSRDKELLKKLEKTEVNSSTWNKLKNISFKNVPSETPYAKKQYIYYSYLQNEISQNTIYVTYSDKQANKGEKHSTLEKLQSLKSKTGISRSSRKNILARLSRIYELKEPLDILRFISQYPDILPLLFEAHLEIKKYFLCEKLILEVISDTESSSWQKLVISIFTKESANEAFNKLNLLDENWWLDAAMSNPAGNQLSLGVEFE